MRVYIVLNWIYWLLSLKFVSTLIIIIRRSIAHAARLSIVVMKVQMIIINDKCHNIHEEHECGFNSMTNQASTG